MDGAEVAVAAIAGAMTIAGTLLGVVVKGRIDRRQFDVEVAARRTDQLLDRRLIAGVEMVDALTRARRELDAIVQGADGDGYDGDGDPAFLKVPRDRPAWLMAALHKVELTSTAPVIDAARVAASTCWDECRDTTFALLADVHTNGRHEPRTPDGDAALQRLTRSEALLKHARSQAMDAEERLRDAIRAESRGTQL